MSPGPPAAPRPRRATWPRVILTLVIVALLVAVSGEAYALRRVDQRLNGAYGQLGDDQKASEQRSRALQVRIAELEAALGKAFNPEAIADAVLPSVFRVSAGQLTGTAFAVGKSAANGGTNLFTNYHVIREVWEGGDKQVFLERQNKRVPAQIVKVDEDNDVAQLQTTEKFTGLATTLVAVKSGQQIVVVGSPLGLEDTVTTGVVSAAARRLDGESGPVIQFDAPINPGNSGGPVINSAKQVVGIASAKARDAEGIGLAIPIATACDLFKVC